ncbi:MAG: 2-hydroxyacid dehydrogenase, partial [Clostridia bacterium]|nr:2-hydroxyacid dehydrogenase [Clostridia bacterium]
MKIAFFDAKPYDKPHFDLLAAERGFGIAYYDTRLDAETARLAAGCEAVCVFVNDVVNAEVIEKLAAGGTRVLALRCAGYNNVDVQHAYGRLHVVHVPAYSPYAVAEHAMALLLTSIRRIHKAFIRTRDFNFSLNGLAGFDLHGKTAGIVGTGKIGRIFADICKGFGMRVIAYDAFPNPASGLEYVSLETLLAESD